MENSRKNYENSIVSPFQDYRGYLTTSYGQEPEIFRHEPIKRWYTPGWVEPIYVSHSPLYKVSDVFPELFTFLL